MIQKIWMYFNRKNWQAYNKFRLFRISLEIIFGIAGLLIWLVVQNRTLKTWDWMLCFIGGPIVISWFVALLYHNYHSFYDGRP